MAETIFWWVFLFGVICAFFLGWEMVGDLVRQWLRNRRARKGGLIAKMTSENPDGRGNGHSDSVLH